MPRKHFSTKAILELNNTDARHRLISSAFEFAVLGHIEVARRLVSQLYAHGTTGQEIVLRPLKLAWSEINNWPDGVQSEDQASLNQLADEYRQGWYSSMAAGDGLLSQTMRKA